MEELVSSESLGIRVRVARLSWNVGTYLLAGRAFLHKHEKRKATVQPTMRLTFSVYDI